MSDPGRHDSGPRDGARRALLRAAALGLAWPASGQGRSAAAASGETTALEPLPPPPPRRGSEASGRTEPPLASAPLASPASPAAAARVWRVGPSGPHRRIADVARQARDGDIVEIEAGDYRGDVAVWLQSRLTIRAVGGAARLFADGQAAEGKAIWVIRRGQFEVENIDFVGARVPHRNGAGIRFEGGRLLLRRCLFWGNETGVLTANSDTAPDAELQVEDCEFGFSRVEGRWAHHLYAGTIARLDVRGCHFHHTDRGHLVKSRARRNALHYNRLVDGPGGNASYELNFPQGGDVVLVGNVIQQSEDSDNPILVSYGEEGQRWPGGRLLMGSNTLVNQRSAGGVFVRVVDPDAVVVSSNNAYLGPGRLVQGAQVQAWNDWRDEASRTEQAARRALRYRPHPQPEIESRLLPAFRQVQPTGVVPLGAPPAWVGADAAPPS